ncbi:acyl-CoA N-acyltransferase [Halteromyces radiatus]|uniref:acyl-CoA N-acyltransferase n=1 Tax=Halteromyces radiatus TaxID=101107 RepID=UPI002220B11E|nr:acyl-CoA N-acyltransferase [Halteromyces radiatus]KAI8092570.1 acyl-CoA N-acyltransferase [Halteromyces radiatus]
MITIEQLKSDKLEEIEQLVPLVHDHLSSSATRTLLQNAVLSPSSFIFVAKTNNNMIVGTATLVTTACLTGLRSHIEDVVVDPAWRCQGIAQQLIETVITYAKDSLDVRTIELTSRPDRIAANSLYQKLGFVQRHTNCYSYR